MNVVSKQNQMNSERCIKNPHVGPFVIYVIRWTGKIQNKTHGEGPAKSDPTSKSNPNPNLTHFESEKFNHPKN